MVRQRGVKGISIIVGQLRKAESLVPGIQRAILWDTTGEIDVESVEPFLFDAVRYYRVVGECCMAASRHVFSLAHLTPVTDMNEITYHGLQAIYETLQ